MSSEGSFLPQILSVFYAHFDPKHGPMIVCQVPEGLITCSPSVAASTQPSIPATPTSEFPPSLASRNSSMSLFSPEYNSPSKRGTSANKALFNFDDISKYVIPPSSLCGKLVRCHTQNHRILGLPVELRGEYTRNYFRFNLCFVFERTADSSCYEPIVRKLSRVLTTCEEESKFLSQFLGSPDAIRPIQMACEQIYEDLNTYAETSISVDQFNSIELKSFPFFPNPSPVHDWMVPVALIDLSTRMEDNWDLTMVKVCQCIDGVTHVGRIAQIAECDLSLTRDAISHLLFYQVIMSIDIFQYSNMYTLRQSIQWLAEEDHVIQECGPYVVRAGRTVPPDWPSLLHLYSRLKPGTTIYEWMQDHDVQQMGIDVRRFTSFGVIKGFLRRVHRWPVYLPTVGVLRSPLDKLDAFEQDPSPMSLPAFTPPLVSGAGLLRGRSYSAQATPSINTSQPPTPSATFQFPASTTVPDEAARVRRMSAAERVLEQLRSRDRVRRTSNPNTAAAAGHPSSANVHAASAWLHRPRKDEEYFANNPHNFASQGSDSDPNQPRRRLSTLTPPQLPAPQSAQTLRPPPPTARPRMSRSPSAPHIFQRRSAGESSQLLRPKFPPEFLAMLDGEHHTDELSVKFNVGWPVLEQWLVEAGGGEESGDHGQIAMIYR